MKIEQLFERGLEYERKEAAAALKLLNAKCRDALWMLHSNRPIWRGTTEGRLKSATSSGAVAIVDPSLTERKSRNTSNHYTLIIDNSPMFHGWPKRSRSMIASAGNDMDSKGHAEDYGHIYAVIPFDNVKIGCTNKGDIWETEVRLFNKREDFDMMNRDFARAGISDKSWDQFVNDVENIDTYDFADHFLNLSLFAMNDRERKVTELKRDNFLPEIIASYAPEKLKFSVRTTATLGNTRGEVWIGGPCVLIREKIWIQMLNDANIRKNRWEDD